MVAKNPELRVKIAALMDAGVPIAKIARQLGISRERVYVIAREIGYRFERTIKPPVR